jgi:hypothetical protein
MPCPNGRTAVPLSSSQATSSETSHELAKDNHNVGGIDGGAPGQHVGIDQPLALAELKQHLHGVTDVCFCHNGDRLGLLNPLKDSFLHDLTVISIIMTLSNIIMKWQSMAPTNPVQLLIITCFCSSHELGAHIADFFTRPSLS